VTVGWGLEGWGGWGVSPLCLAASVGEGVLGEASEAQRGGAGLGTQA